MNIFVWLSNNIKLILDISVAGRLDIQIPKNISRDQIQAVDVMTDNLGEEIYRDTLRGRVYNRFKIVVVSSFSPCQ